MNRFIIILFILFSHTYSVKAEFFLFNAGKSDYCIVVPQTASISENTAAKELQTYLKQISGVTLDIINKIPVKGNYIYIGYNKVASNVRPAPTDEKYTYKTIGTNLFIWGGADRGTMYGVFSFLENELGVRWYTSDYTKIPQRESYILPKLNHTENPCIKHRLDFYYTPLSDAVWCAHNKLNDKDFIVNNNYGNLSACLGVHTMYNLVPPDTFYSSHPEYYSEQDGKRQYENGQLCLSNNNVLSIVKSNILKIIKDAPDFWVYDVSQMDNQNFCQCKNCMKIANQYGGQSGLMIWFVNQVADTVRQVYPNKMISTFAYQYTRQAPIGIKPRDNVVIRLCDIECCFSHPLSSTKCEKNIDFMSDLKAWGRISKNIYIWDYVVNFWGYHVPYPNFLILAQNIKTLSNNKTIGILEEGAYECKWAEFSELRAWLIAKLLWNPYQDVMALAKEFCMDYYGRAANDIYAYFLMTQKIPAKSHVIYCTQYEQECYDDKFIRKSKSLLNKALNKVKEDSILCVRVNRVLAQVYYLECLQNFFEAKENGSYEKLQEILRNDPTNVREGKKNIEEVLEEQGYI